MLVANHLFLSTLHMACLVNSMGGWACLEQPSDRGVPYVSFLRTSQIVEACEELGAQILVIAQCVFGCIIEKTTGIWSPCENTVAAMQDRVCKCPAGKHAQFSVFEPGIDGKTVFASQKFARYRRWTGLSLSLPDESRTSATSATV